MIKVLFFADSHLGFDLPVHPRIQRRRRGDDFFANYHTILRTAVEEQVHVIVHGGDVFFRSKIPLPIIQKTYEPLLPILDRGIQMFFVPGNHERSKLPASPIFHHENFFLFGQPRLYTMEYQGLRVNWGGFPNVRHQIRSSFESILSQIGFHDLDSDLNILCMHQAIEGAVVGAQDYTFRRGPDVIGLEQFPAGIDLVLSGHIHRQQVLQGRGGIPILYPGSIERTSFAERFETKGFFMLQVTESQIDWEFRPLPARPMHLVSLSPELSSKEDLMEEIREAGNALPDDTILRVQPSRADQLVLLSTKELRSVLPETMNVELLPQREHLPQRWSAYSS